MCICMSKSFYEEINLLLFVQYESEHVMNDDVSFFDKLYDFLERMITKNLLSEEISTRY